ncbi:MAG: FAD:protein FMN transferase, partial [Acidobacteriota bacterium]
MKTSAVAQDRRLRASARVLPRAGAALALLTATALMPSAASAEPVRLAMEVLGQEAQIEVRDVPRERAIPVMREALLEMFEVSQLVDGEGGMAGGVADIHRAAQAGAASGAEVDPRTFELLRRGLQLCLWSSGAFSPLGGGVYALWEGGHPPALELRTAVTGAGCNLLQLAPEVPPRVSIPAASTLDLRGLSAGFAIDRAADVLLAAGIDNALVELGEVARALGGGPAGDGWLATIPGVAGTRDPLDRILLRDQSLATVRLARRGDGGPQLVDLRTGVRSSGVVAVTAVS